MGGEGIRKAEAPQGISQRGFSYCKVGGSRLAPHIVRITAS